MIGFVVDVDGEGPRHQQMVGSDAGLLAVGRDRASDEGAEGGDNFKHVIVLSLWFRYQEDYRSTTMKSNAKTAQSKI